MSQLQQTKLRIPEFYQGRSVFVTGGSGFVGKVLIEKLLRSCPGVNKIYVLLRSKKKKNPGVRLEEMVNLPLFDILREDRPEVFRKLIPVNGDVSLLGLGISCHDHKTLSEEVSVVFDCAASVKFDDSLKHAVLVNARATREAVKIALGMTNLVAFVHVSTTYCNTDRCVIEEVVYPPHGNYKEVIDFVERESDSVLEDMTPKFLGNLPNTYAFSKSLAEHIVNDHSGPLPAVIFRPSIVIPTLKDPFPGWMDNLNGPIGLMVANGKGIMRSIYGNLDTIADYVPVDVAVKGMIAAAWHVGTTRPKATVVLNCSATSNFRLSYRDLNDRGLKALDDIPLNGALWYPTRNSFTRRRWLHLMKVGLFHFLPAAVIDSLLFITGRKPRLLKIQTRVFRAMRMVECYVENQWTFVREGFDQLMARVPPEDAEAFNAAMEDADIDEYFRNGALGARKYILKEDSDTLPQARIHYKRLYYIDKFVKILFGILMLWFVV